MSEPSESKVLVELPKTLVSQIEKIAEQSGKTFEELLIFFIKGD